MNRIVVLMLAVGLLGAACSSSGSQEPSPSVEAAGGTAPSTTAPAKAAPVPQSDPGLRPEL